MFACSMGIISHYAPIPFPTNSPLLVICAVLYFITSAILQYFVTYKQKDIIVTTDTFEVSTTIGSLDGKYSISIVPAGIQKPNTTPTSIEKEYSIGEFFDYGGNLAKTKFQAEMKKLLTNYRKKIEEKRHYPVFFNSNNFLRLSKFN